MERNNTNIGKLKHSVPKNHYFIMNKFTLLSLAKNTDTYKGCVWPGKLHDGFTRIMPQQRHQEPHATTHGPTSATTTLGPPMQQWHKSWPLHAPAAALEDLTRKLSWKGGVGCCGKACDMIYWYWPLEFESQLDFLSLLSKLRKWTPPAPNTWGHHNQRSHHNKIIKYVISKGEIWNSSRWI